MEVINLLERIGFYAGTAAFLGLAFVIPLYVSQRRDVQRLRLWADYAPHAPDEAEQVAATGVRLAREAAITDASAQAATQRAERRAARRAERGEPEGAAQPAAVRVASERPAAARVTGEMAVYREPRWRTWIRRGPTTRELLMVMGGAFVIGLAVVAGSQLLLGGGADSPEVGDTAGGTGILKEEVDVAVLNGTAVPGLAARVADDVEANGYFLGAVTNSPTPATETVVLYESGHEAEAKLVAKDLGVEVVQLIDPESRELADGADVVVVAGEDRAQ